MLAAAAEPSAPREKHQVVRITGRSRKQSYETMAPDAVKEFERSIREEGRYFSKALMQARKAWQAEERHKGKSFPTAAVKARQIRVMATFDDRAKAEAKVAQYKAQMDEAEERDRERAKKKSKDKEKDAREAAQQAEREALHSEAVSLFEAKLQELVGGGAGKEPAVEKHVDDVR